MGHYGCTFQQNLARRAAKDECPPGLRLVGAEEKAGIMAKLSEEKVKGLCHMSLLCTCHPSAKCKPSARVTPTATCHPSATSPLPRHPCHVTIPPQVKAETALRALPFVIRTNASQTKKDQLEARLEEIEGAVAAYRREKVFVPADM